MKYAVPALLALTQAAFAFQAAVTTPQGTFDLVELRVVRQPGDTWKDPAGGAAAIRSGADQEIAVVEMKLRSGVPGNFRASDLELTVERGGKSERAIAAVAAPLTMNVGAGGGTWEWKYPALVPKGAKVSSFRMHDVTVDIDADGKGVIPQGPSAEDRDLRVALAETGSSPLEFVRALEKHLEKYPNSSQKAQLERALAKASLEAKDDRRTLLYGERVLAKEMDDPMLLERVTRILLKSDDQQSSERALKYAKKFEEIMRALEREGPSQSRKRAQIMEELDRAIGRSLVFQARATGNLGKTEEAIRLATQSYDRYPTAESAREIGRWLARTGRTAEAVERYADAFTIEDSRNTQADRARDRAQLTELWTKLKGTEAGLGDAVLKAYDRTAELMGRRAALQKASDPNAGLTEVMDFTLAGLKGEKLELASLKGKVVVMDFWATWCGPCRVQHPLYEKVKAKYAGNPDVVFLSVNTDEDQSVVEPFLQANKWTQKVWFEGGLSELLRVSSIPTTIIVNRDGRVVNRMNGFLPDRFVDMLTERIQDALGGTLAQK